MVVFLETSTAGFYRAHSLRPQNDPCVEATVEAIGGFTGHTCCGAPIDLQMLRGMALHDRNIGSQRFGSITSMTTSFAVVGSFCLCRMALGDLLMLLGAESRNVSGLFKTMLEHTFTSAHIHPYIYICICMFMCIYTPMPYMCK